MNSGLVRTVGGDRVAFSSGADITITGKGRMYYLLVDNYSGADLWAVGFDDTAKQDDGTYATTVLFTLRVFSGTTSEMNINGGIPFGKGLVVALSSTAGEMTYAASTTTNFTVAYVLQ